MAKKAKPKPKLTSEQLFKVKARPFFWRQKAEELKAAAEIIWPRAEARFDIIYNSIESNEPLNMEEIGPEIFPTFMGLIGYSTECLFKAVIMKNHPEYVSNGILSKKMKSHDLIELSETAGVQLSKEEKIFCRQANRAIIEFRYPIPMKAKEINHLHEIGGHCRDVYIAIYTRLYPTVGL